jgi:membrane fusion protein, heavy metal efflux system
MSASLDAFTEPHPMHLTHAERFAGGAAALLLALVLSACGGNDGAKPKPDQKSTKASNVAGKDEHRDEEGAIKLTDDEIKTAGIRVEPVHEQELSNQLVVTATIQANQDRLARLAPRVPGRVASVRAQLGERVAAGQALAVLDSIEVGEARSAHAQAESEARVTQASLERAQRLQAEQIVSQKDFLRARAEHDKAQAALGAASEKLAMLGVSVTRSGDSVSTFALTAPFAGTVIEKKAVVGELAQPDKALFAIADLSVLWIEANLMEKDLAQVKVGDEVVVTVEAYPKDQFKGRLTYIGGMLDKETRTIKGRVEVGNADGRLKPEMFASAAIQTASKAKAIVLPEEAVVLVSGQSTVFIEEHGGFEPRTIELGPRLQGRVVVKAGLKPDDIVVVSGTYALKARLLKGQIGEGHAH